MRKRIGMALCAVLVLCATARAQNPSKDERQIRALAKHWQDDWNHHNFTALANLLSVDGDYVTDQGVLLRGRTEFENWFGKVHRQMYLNSHWTNTDVKLRFLQPEIVLVHLSWGMHGDLDQRGMPRKGRPGISTWLVVKVGDGWKIRAAQDTSRP